MEKYIVIEEKDLKNHFQTNSLTKAKEEVRLAKKLLGIKEHIFKEVKYEKGE